MEKTIAPSALLTGLRFAGCLPHADEPPRGSCRVRQKDKTAKPAARAASNPKEVKPL